ncbi:MAG: YceI family protein, partial [Bacteroidota bacterium]
MTTGNWILDKSKSNIRFKVKHLLLASVQGEFTGFDIQVTRTGDTFSHAGISLEMQSASIDTRIRKRDEHLIGKDFLDAEEFPTITFESAEVKEYKEKGYRISGTLTMKGISKEITFYATLTPSDQKDQFGNLELEASISRSEFGITWNESVNGNWPLVDDTITIYGNIFLVEPTNGDRVKGVAGRQDVFGDKSYLLYTAAADKQDGSFVWKHQRNNTKEWIFGLTTGKSDETYFRALKTKLYIEKLAAEYDHIRSPSQFLRVLHFEVQEDPFLYRSLYDNDTYSLDTAYLMIDPASGTIKYASARLNLVLLKKNGMKLLPKISISLGFPYYNVGQLTDQVVGYEPGDTLFLFNDELLQQPGGSQQKKLGAKAVSNLLSENKTQPWEKRVKHFDRVLKKWVGEMRLEDILVAQIQ